MNNNDRKDQNGPNKEPPRSGRKILTIILIAVIVTIVLRLLTAGLGGNNVQEITYTEFEQMIAKGEVKSVLFQNDRILITPKTEESEQQKAPSQLVAGGTSNPDDILSRGEVAQIISNTLKLVSSSKSNPFKDIQPGTLYYEPVLACYDSGIIFGFPDKTVRATEPITREQAFVIISRITNLSPDATAAGHFVDGNKASSWATGAIGALFNAGVLDSDQTSFDSEIRPKEQITRAEFLKLFDDIDKTSNVGYRVGSRVGGSSSTTEQLEPIGIPQIYSLLKTQQKPQLYYTGLIPNLALNELKQQLDDAGVPYESAVQEETSLLWSIISWLLPVAAMYLLFTLLMNVMSKRMGGGGLGGIGKNKAKVYMEKQTGVTFADVAGQDEAKESLVEIIDFLHNPQKYAEIGAKLPKGALLIGSPGTGKTLLAKAVAGEANVPFFSISGSDFVEMFVGVGASRVRDLFNEASKVAPSIIFIDEIDAIGRTRDSKFGGNDEREQTLNQLLAEIDGFDSSKGVVILAATNRPEILDKALLRAGRFDRRIIVDRPNLAGRYQTLKVHTKNIKLADDVDLNKIAQATAGAVGADLASLVNEAALRAVRQGRKTVNQEDLMTSFEFVIAGTEKKGTILTDMEKRIVAYHEVGHALVAALEKHAQPVSKITIVPHTSGALGYTMQMPEEEKFLSSKEELITELKTLLGGRAAEQTVFGVQTTGAANDIERATELARKMITQYGMSDRFGLMALSTVSNPYLDGSTMMNCADETAAQADTEIKALLESCYAESMRILKEKRELLDEIALYLLEKETIVGEELMSFIEADRKQNEKTEETPAEEKQDDASAESGTPETEQKD